MKRKHVAIILGLILSMTSMNMAFAADSSETAETEAAAEETEAVDDAEAEEDIKTEEAVFGRVTEVGTDSITVALGEIAAPEAENTEDTKTSDESENSDSEETADVSKNTVTEEQAESGGTVHSVLKETGEEQTISITYNTGFEKEIFLNEEETDNTMYTAEEDTAEVENAEEENADTDGTAADTPSVDTEYILESDFSGENVPEITTEVITADEIQVGDIVRIIFDEDGNAATVTVLDVVEDDTDEIPAEASVSETATDTDEEEIADEA